MGIDLSFAVYVSNDSFIPTKQQLRGIASILRGLNIVDMQVYKQLDDNINVFFPEGTSPVVVKDEQSGKYSDIFFPSDHFPYRINKFPFFDVSNETGEVDTQVISIYRDPYSISGMLGEKTRLVIAYVDHGRGYDDDWLSPILGRMERHPTLMRLRVELTTLLSVPIEIGACYS
jgi:hypothetical protein